MLPVLAVTCIALVLSPVTFADAFPFVMAFPFAQIGRGLRVLSLQGGVSNAVAIALYVAVCLLPMSALLLIRKKRAEDALLLLISIVLFFVMYFMINPGLIGMAIHAVSFERALLGGMVYSLLLAYAVIRVLRLFGAASSCGLRRYIGIILHLLNAMFIFMIFGIIFAQMLGDFAALGDANTDPQQQLSVTYVFLAMQHLVNALPFALNTWVVFAAQRLLAALRANQYSEETLTAAKNVSRVCATALAVSVLSIAGFNLLQLIFVSRLHVVNSNVNFPVASVLFVLGALLLSRYIAENKRLKDEYDQFV